VPRWILLRTVGRMGYRRRKLDERSGFMKTCARVSMVVVQVRTKIPSWIGGWELLLRIAVGFVVMIPVHLMIIRTAVSWRIFLWWWLVLILGVETNLLIGRMFRRHRSVCASGNVDTHIRRDI
jgi:hypothetical protein